MSMLSAGMSVIGGVVGAAGAMQQAEAEAKAHEYNAAVATRNERIIKQQTKAARQDQKLENKRQLATIRTLYANSGVSLTGSALDVMMDTRREQELTVKRISYKGKLAAIEQRDKRNLELMGADSARAAGAISAVSSILGGIGGAASALSRAA